MPLVTGGGPAITLTSGQTASWQLENPVGSGSTFRLARLYCQPSMPGIVAFEKDATSTGTVRTPFPPDFSSAYVPKAVLRSGIDVLASGTPIDIEAQPQPWGVGFVFEESTASFSIPPGGKVALTYTAPTHPGIIVRVTANALWSES